MQRDLALRGQHHSFYQIIIGIDQIAHKEVRSIGHIKPL